MYIKLKFKTFYKIVNSHKYSNVKPPALIATPNIVSPATAVFVFYLLIINMSKTSKFYNKPAISWFLLPARKKTVIFLRAPYKNKLARLNILRPEYTLIFSIKIHTTFFQTRNYSILNTIDFCNLLFSNAHLNLSTHKNKHAKSTVYLNLYAPHNFAFNNFN